MGEIFNLFNIIFTFPIFNGLILLYHLFGDFGLSIVVLTLIIKLILFPLTLQQLKSTKATQALQPQMQEIRKKYANDQQAQAAALQNLYKEYGVNPLAGCLPLLVQMPVLYGLYYALSTGVRTDKLKDINAHIYPFIPHFTALPKLTFDWFAWLSFLNPILHVNWSWTFPLNAPDPSHVLPILAGLATFVSLRMAQPRTAAATATTNGKPAASDPTQQSMKMMQYVMPFFTVFIGWNFPSGLALYWTISSIFQAVQQYFVTGWGALLTTPTMKKEVAPASVSSSATTDDKISTVAPRTKKPTVVESKKEVADKSESTAISQLRTTTPTTNGNGPSQYTRRKQGGSASARRRSGSQKAR